LRFQVFARLSTACHATNFAGRRFRGEPTRCGSEIMGGIIYLIGLIVVIMAILSFLGLR
jgi:hypothetical protein